MDTDVIWGYVQDFEEEMREKELQEKTIRKYHCDLERFLMFAGSKCSINKDIVVAYRQWLLTNYQPVTVISYLMTVNHFLRWMQLSECCVKLPRVQQRYSTERTMSLWDYQTLLDYAIRQHRWKYYGIMRTLAGTGIRVGELHFVTCEVLAQKTALVSNKNKIREIYFTDELCELLKEYSLRAGIVSGPIFLGRGQQPIGCSSVWKTLKYMAQASGVNPEVVYPHSFRHLFARTYMQKVGEITELADILGHSSLETTRIYTMGTKEEKRRTMAILGL